MKFDFSNSRCRPPASCLQLFEPNDHAGLYSLQYGTGGLSQAQHAPGVTTIVGNQQLNKVVALSRNGCFATGNNADGQNWKQAK